MTVESLSLVDPPDLDLLRINGELASNADAYPLSGSYMERVGWLRRHDPVDVVTLAERRPFRALELLDAETDERYGLRRPVLLADLKRVARGALQD